MIRPFHVEDAPGCCALIRECVSRDRFLSAPLRKKLLELETPETTLERARLFYMAVYEFEERALGIIGLDMNEIRLLCVDPGFRRHGIGHSLVDHARAMVPAALFPDVFVYSSIEGKNFYKDCGFIEKGPVEFDIAGEKMPTIFMTLPLR